MKKSVLLLSIIALALFASAQNEKVFAEGKLKVYTVETPESGKFKDFTYTKHTTSDSIWQKLCQTKYDREMSKISKDLDAGYEIVEVVPITYTEDYQKGQYDSCPCDKQYCYTKYERWVLRKK